MSKISIDIDQLTVSERLDLIGELWDSIKDDDFEDDLSPEQKEEMDTIMREAELHPEQCLTLEEAFREIRSRKR